MVASLPDVLDILQEMAPLRLAAPWDNVGLLIEPVGQAKISRAFFTIDLTERSFAEAVAEGAQLVFAYHPPIFQGLKRLRATEAKDRVIMGAIRAGLAVYSPHTALDAVPGGVNDWLARGLGPGERSPIEVTPPHPQVPAGAGMGRWVKLNEPIAVGQAVNRLKAHLGQSTLRIAVSDAHAKGQLIAMGAVCAGAGGSVLCKATDADLLVTGEMRHHDVLDAVARGQSVILSEHTHTERGFLPEFAAAFRARTDNAVEVVVSCTDADPLTIE